MTGPWHQGYAGTAGNAGSGAQGRLAARQTCTHPSLAGLLHACWNASTSFSHCTQGHTQQYSCSSELWTALLLLLLQLPATSEATSAACADVHPLTFARSPLFSCRHFCSAFTSQGLSLERCWPCRAGSGHTHAAAVDGPGTCSGWSGGRGRGGVLAVFAQLTCCSMAVSDHYNLFLWKSDAGESQSPPPFCATHATTDRVCLQDPASCDECKCEYTCHQMCELPAPFTS